MNGTRVQEAVEKKQSGTCNCAQAVACTYCDFAGVDEQTIHAAGQAFGSGFGNMEGTCGAISGAALVLGLRNKDRAKSMNDVRSVMNKFKERNSTTVCKELKGVGTGKVLRGCNDCVADAAEFLEEILKND